MFYFVAWGLFFLCFILFYCCIVSCILLKVGFFFIFFILSGETEKIFSVRT